MRFFSVDTKGFIESLSDDQCNHLAEILTAFPAPPDENGPPRLDAMLVLHAALLRRLLR